MPVRKQGRSGRENVVMMGIIGLYIILAGFLIWGLRSPSKKPEQPQVLGTTEEETEALREVVLRDLFERYNPKLVVFLTVEGEDASPAFRSRFNKPRIEPGSNATMVPGHGDMVFASKVTSEHGVRFYLTPIHWLSETDAQIFIKTHTATKAAEGWELDLRREKGRWRIVKKTLAYQS